MSENYGEMVPAPFVYRSIDPETYASSNKCVIMWNLVILRQTV